MPPQIEMRKMMHSVSKFEKAPLCSVIRKGRLVMKINHKPFSSLHQANLLHSLFRRKIGGKMYVPLRGRDFFSKGLMLSILVSILLSASSITALEKPTLLEEFVTANPPFASCHASTITETQDGTLLVAYFAGSEEGSKDVGIFLSRKTKDGWTSPKKVASEKDAPCWNPVLYTLPSNKVLLFYKAGDDPRSWSGFLMESVDQGQSWSSPKILPAGILGPVKNKPLALKDGTLLCGSSTESYHAWGCFVDITKDGGRSWEKSNPISVQDQPQGIIQPTLFLSHSERLMMLARSYRVQYICFATSEDNGKTWTDAHPTKLPNPNSGIDATRLQDGRILLVYNNCFKGRTPLNIALSEDGGETWKMVFTLEKEEGEYSYPAVVQTADQLVHVTYTWDRKNIKHVVIDPALL